MSLPRSLFQPVRQGQLTVGNGWRAYFAPFNQELAVSQSSTVLGPTIYDLEVSSKFLDATPPAGWLDLGWINKFKFTPGSKIGSVVAGYRGVIKAKYRAETSEKVTLSFSEQSHLAYKIATGSQVFNLLKSTATASTSGPLSSSGTAATPCGASGYLATGYGTGAYQNLPILCVPAGSGALFTAGTYIVCDQDYNTTTTGFVGDAGANVFPGSVPNDVDFIRKTSDYVQGIRQVVSSGAAGWLTGQDGLVLMGAFAGGGNAQLGQTVSTTPNLTTNTSNGGASAAKVQIVSGYAVREGGTMIAEWSAVFCLDTIDGSQLLFYYPRLAIDAFSGHDEVNLENANSMKRFDLAASFDAMAFDDPLDGETVVCYRAYFPKSFQSAGI